MIDKFSHGDGVRLVKAEIGRVVVWILVKSRYCFSWGMRSYAGKPTPRLLVNKSISTRSFGCL